MLSVVISSITLFNAVSSSAQNEPVFAAANNTSDALVQVTNYSSPGDAVKNEYSDSNRVIHIKPLIAPATLIAYGFCAINMNFIRQLDYSTQRSITKNNPGFKTSLDNYSQFLPAFTVYGLNAAGVKGKNNFWDRTLMYGISTIVSGGAAVTLKRISSVTRPDGSAPTSFPSGHTTTAFVAAEFLNQEFKHKSVLYSIGGYAIATATGIARMYNNRHYLSDVICGAGIGILTTKLVYMVYPAIKKKCTKHSAHRNNVL